MHRKFIGVTAGNLRNINSVMTRLRHAHERSLHEFKFNDQHYRSDSTSHQQSRLSIAGLVAVTAVALLNSADAEEPLNPKKYSRNVYLTNMETLISTHYPRLANLPEELLTLIIEQLDWVQQNTAFTPQASVIYELLIIKLILAIILIVKYYAH